MLPKNRPFKEDWLKLEQLLVVAILYHSGMLDDVQKAIKIDFNGENLTSDEQQIVDQFRIIGKQIDQQFGWML